MQAYASLFQKSNNNIMLLSCDDKAKIKFGEPHNPLATLARNRPGIAPTTSTISAVDHDVANKGSLTPSVILNVAIPENQDDSFYTGQVTVLLKDSVFEASNSFRSILEMEMTARQNLTWNNRNILIVYTDGGPERMVTYESVKIPLCVLFRRNPNLDIVIALRTAPGQSYVNYVERIMSILNIGFQNMAISREEMSMQFEKVVRSCKGWDELRDHPEIKGDWEASL